MFDEIDVYEDSERQNAALNMAIDEALLESATKPTLRFYGWKGPRCRLDISVVTLMRRGKAAVAIEFGVGPGAALFCTAMT